MSAGQVIAKVGSTGISTEIICILAYHSMEAMSVRGAILAADNENSLSLDREFLQYDR